MENISRSSRLQTFSRISKLNCVTQDCKRLKLETITVNSRDAEYDIVRQLISQNVKYGKILKGEDLKTWKSSRDVEIRNMRRCMGRGSSKD